MPISVNTSASNTDTVNLLLMKAKSTLITCIVKMLLVADAVTFVMFADAIAFVTTVAFPAGIFTE